MSHTRGYQNILLAARSFTSGEMAISARALALALAASKAEPLVGPQAATR